MSSHSAESAVQEGEMSLPTRTWAKRVGLRVFAVGLLLLVPAAARAQSAIAGQVTDSTGAVLPGVMVDAASPALIEGSRGAVTDGQGRASW